jgi:hypothetical protein
MARWTCAGAAIGALGAARALPINFAFLNFRGDLMGNILLGGTA